MTDTCIRYNVFRDTNKKDFEFRVFLAALLFLFSSSFPLSFFLPPSLEERNVGSLFDTGERRTPGKVLLKRNACIRVRMGHGLPVTSRILSAGDRRYGAPPRDWPRRLQN